MNRKFVNIVVTTLAIVLAITFLYLRKNPIVDKNFRLPALNSISVNNIRVGEDSFKNQVVVVNFFATWCIPCVYEMPSFERVFENPPIPNLTIIAMDEDLYESDLVIKEFIEIHKLKFPIFRTNINFIREFPNVSGIPKTYIFDGHGKLVKFHFGAISQTTLRKSILAAARAK